MSDKLVRDEYPIVFVSDDNYAMPTAVAIFSLKTNKSNSSAYRLFILADSISEDNKKKILEMSDENFVIEIIDINSDYYSSIGNSSIPKTIHVSKAALFKFLIPTIFTQYKSILYLDGDIIIKHDLKELFSVSLDGYYVAAVDDMKAIISYQPSQNVKLGVSHEHYFNTGVMFLNLELMRANDVSNKLLDYRSNGINYFMDQDAFNVVFEDKVKIVPFKYNTIYSNYEYYSLQDLKTFYLLNENSREELIDNSVILHLSSKQKPWLYSDMEFTPLWDTYHLKSPFSCVLERKTVVEPTIDSLKKDNELLSRELNGIKRSASYRIGCLITAVPRFLIKWRKVRRTLKPNYVKNGLNSGELRSKNIIVSLTSYPARNEVLPKVLESLLKQTMKPDRIIVYLSLEQYPSKKITRNMQKAKKYGIEFEFVDDDLKPHKKYFYSIQSFPEDIIITVDDDIYYHPKLIERLYKCYEAHPNCVSASRVHKITFNDKGEINPYNLWEKNYTQRLGKESMKLIATGVGGVLYPPGVIPSEAFDSTAIKETCLYADDLWLKMMEVANNIKVVLASRDNAVNPISGSQKEALWRNNVDSNENDIQLSKIIDSFKERKSIVIKRISEDCNAEIIDCDVLNYVDGAKYNLSAVSNLNIYLKSLEFLKDSCIIIMTTADSVSANWGMIHFPVFIGNVEDPGYRCAFTMVFDSQNNKKIMEYGEKYSRATYETESLSITAVSYGFDGKNKPYVIFDNGKKWAYYSDKVTRGLFIIVYSKILNRVIDFAVCDPHKDKSLRLKHL